MLTINNEQTDDQMPKKYKNPKRCHENRCRRDLTSLLSVPAEERIVMRADEKRGRGRRGGNDGVCMEERKEEIAAGLGWR